ncbi:MAG: hydrolase [Eubacteriales bacterium]|nr:hydrolase [Eubacteriales bacterium]MDD3198401.1 hydrolase [Eubacteriales bacterium]MDD3504812.1 hydrolase [Eubacteriales bacterium]MDD4683338.1 hydrolase [Eubacteriales bacterium]
MSIENGKIESKYFIERESAVLLIVDIQTRLVPAIADHEQIVHQSSVLLQTANLMELPVLATEQYPRGLGSTVEEIKQDLPEKVVVSEKISFDACTDEIRQALLASGRKQVIICGMETHVCVYQTVRRLLADGYEVFVAADAVGSRTVANKENALAMFRQMGAVVSNTETLIFDLLQVAGTPLFKQVSALIK